MRVSMPTDLMRDGERGVKAVVLDDGAASLRRADGADIRHAQGVAGVVATEVLDKGNTVSLNWQKNVHVEQSVLFLNELTL